MPLFNCLIHDERLYSGLQTLASKSQKCHSTVRCTTYFNILRC